MSSRYFSYAILDFPLDRNSSDVINEIGQGTRGIAMCRCFVFVHVLIFAECTLLKAEGKPCCDVNKNVLFAVEAVEQYILHSKNSVIIIKLARVDNGTELLQNSIIMSQMSIVSHFSQNLGAMPGCAMMNFSNEEFV